MRAFKTTALLWLLLPAALGLLRPGNSPGANPPTNAVPLFNGKDLSGWAVSDFGARGEVTVENHQLIIGLGEMLTGVTLTNLALLPHGEYEVTLEAKKIEGSDFFCGLTFPVAKSSCTLIVGGWGGGLVGLSSINDFDASENSAAKILGFEKNRWYRIRLAVQTKSIQCWIDDDQVIDADIEGKKISLRTGEIYRSEPFGLATYQTRAAIRNFGWRPLPAK
jgi:hypothetical protein